MIETLPSLSRLVDGLFSIRCRFPTPRNAGSPCRRLAAPPVGPAKESRLQVDVPCRANQEEAPP